MKHLIKSILLLLALLLPATSSAYDFQVNGIYYNKSGTNATVTYKSYSNGTYSSDYSGSVTIPSTVTYGGTTYTVTSIGSYAFNNCTELTNISIPNSVTSIGGSAFYGCMSITGVLTIPNSVTFIGREAFYGCSGLSGELSIPNTVTQISTQAFSYCSGLTSVIIPNSITSIEPYAFAGCTALNSVVMGSSVASIDYNAFSNCSSLTSVHISDLKAWCKIAFITYDSNPLYYAHHLFLNGVEIKDLVIPSTITAIGNFAFYNCYGLTSVTIPNSVTSIGSSSFLGCSSLKNVTIGNFVTSIGSTSFYGCSGLTSVSIPSSVTSIGNSAFNNCSNLRTLIWNAINCTSIGGYAFNTSLTTLQFGNAVEHIPAGLPSLSMSGKTLLLPNSVKTIDSGAFTGSCGAVVIGDNIENIAAGSFPTGISVAYATPTEPRPCEEGAFANPQTLYVPSGSKMKYFTSEGWSEFANIVEGEYVRATSITLNKSSVALSKGGTQQLNATIWPSNASASSVTWLSMNPAVATVSSSGKVTAIAMGETDIVAMVDNVRATCHVTVTPVMVNSLTLSDTQLNLAPDDMYTLTANVLPTNADNKTLEWIIPDNNVIVTQVVNNTRLNIGAIGTGSVTITVRTTDGSNLSSTCTVNVQVSATSVALNMTSAEMTVGGVLQLTATVLPTNATNRTVTWKSSNTSIATVNSSGLVTAKSPGSAIITATTTDGTNLSATCSLLVKQNIVYASSISLNKSSAKLVAGQQMQLLATVLPENTTNKTVTWSSSNSSIATVNSEGEVTAIAPGTVTITAKTSDGTNLAATCVLTVMDYTFSIDDMEAYAGTTVTIPINVTNTDILKTFMFDLHYPEGFRVISYTKTDRMTQGSSIFVRDFPDDHYMRYISANFESNFVVEAGDGPIMNIRLRIPDNASGEYVVSLKGIEVSTTSDVTGCKLSDNDAVLTVHEAVQATSIQLNQVNAVLNKDQTLQLTATVLPDNTTDKSVTWSSSDTSVASVDENGMVTALAAGTTTITVTTMDGSNLSASCEVTVVEDISNYDNYLSINDINAFRGETIVIPVAMINESTIISFQTDIFLPDGLELVQEDGSYLVDPSDRMTRTHSIMSELVSSGAIRVVCYSSNYKPFTGNSGDDLFYITVKVADDATEGDYTISLRNTLFTTNGFDEIAGPDVTSIVHVNPYLMGDANGSGTVTVTDVVVTSQYVLELNPQPFIFEAADVNSDNNITVTDVTRIAWMVLNPNQNALMRAPALYNNGDIMSGKNITLMPGETRTVSILLDNVMDYSAFQFDLNLPTGLTATNFQLTDRASNHAFDVNVLSNGKTRALCYSPALEIINGHNGALLTFDVTASSAIEGAIEVDNIELVTSACQTVKLNDFAIGVNAVTSVNELAKGKTIARVDYFNMAGQQIDQPDGGVTLVVTTYTDGTRTTNKIIR